MAGVDSAPRVRTHRTFCRMCPTQCGVVVSVKDDRAIGVVGDFDHPISRGYTCPKGRAIVELHNHPKRLTGPSVGRGDAARARPWDEVMAELADRLSSIVEEHGPDSVALYSGTAAHLDAGASYASGLVAHLGSRSVYSSSTVDDVPFRLAAELVSGHDWLVPLPDPHAELTVLIGTNPMRSHGYTCTMPRPKEQLRTWARSGELWVIDPRRTETADVATHHLKVRPGTDYLLLAYLARELLRGGADRAFLDRETDGADTLSGAVECFDLNRVTRSTGLSASDVLALLQSVRSSRRAAFIAGSGVTFAEHGTLTCWLTWVLNALTGSLDAEGGVWFSPGLISRRDAKTWEPSRATPAPGPRSRPELPGRYGELPVVALPDEIEAGNVRAVIVLGGNLLTALPDPDRTRRALEALDVLAIVDIVASTFTSLATHLLPAAGILERDDLTAEDFMGLHPSAHYTAAVVAPSPGRRALWRILAELTLRLGGVLPGAVDPSRSTDGEALRANYGADAAFWDRLVTAPTALPGQRRYGWTKRNLPGGRWQLAPREFLQALHAVGEPVRQALTLTSMRQLQKTNSILSQDSVMRRPAQPHVGLNPEDAARAEISHGDDVVVRSEFGHLRLRAHLDDRVDAGYVSISNGFEDANVNRLFGGTAVDPLTGMPRFTGLAVRLEKCAETVETQFDPVRGP